MKQLLMITLGHNASAVLYNTETHEVIGYEQERLTRIKGDSQFPADAILEIMKHSPIIKGDCMAYISHWFPIIDSLELGFAYNKYYTEENHRFLCSIVGIGHITSLRGEFSHHDAHAFSVMAFRDYFNWPASQQLNCFGNSETVFTIVADGFGNNREVLSIYKTTKSTYETMRSGHTHLIRRIYGYGLSLGLMYQYATSFVGMKENQDEYKFLGYESYITPEDAELIHEELMHIVRYFTSDYNEVERPSDDLTTEIKALHGTKKFWYNKFETIMSYFIGRDIDVTKKRAIVGYAVQFVVENAIAYWVRYYGMEHVNVAGGLFYNVKLNNKILNMISGTFCAMPLAGDQGAAIGLAYNDEPSFSANQFNFSNLCWGKRTFYGAEKMIAQQRGDIHYADSFTSVHAEQIATRIANGEIVNIVGGSMEFGPRALCHTTTLFLPTKENTAANNAMNGRNEVMPCAPVCTYDDANKMFFRPELSRVIGSDYFMICTHEYTPSVHYNSLRQGAMHKIPMTLGCYTGRPQIANPYSAICDILVRAKEKTGIDPFFLVNTSFNAHGQPIVFDLHAIMANYTYQCEHAKDGKKPSLYIFKELQ